MDSQGLKCLRCDAPMYDDGPAMLHRGVFFMTRQLVRTYRCPACGKLEFFAGLGLDSLAPEAGSDGIVAGGPRVSDIGEEFNCLDCGHPIKPDQTRCEKCGWTWK